MNIVLPQATTKLIGLVSSVWNTKNGIKFIRIMHGEHFI